MYYFTSDYTEGCTPEILEALAATNFEQTGGYGIDPYCETAALLIKKECGRSDIDVHFMTGGTQTNLTIICAALRPFHGVYGTVQSHINTHEAGAILDNIGIVHATAFSNEERRKIEEILA